MISINKNLVLFSSLLVALLILISFAIDKAYPLLGHAVYYCQSVLKSYMIPVPKYLGLLLFGLLLMIIVLAVLKFAFLLFKMRRLKNELNKNNVNTSSSYDFIKSMNLGDKTLVIRTNKRFAFCLGLIKPKIYISTGLISSLSKKELEIVLRHEEYHIKKHDTLTMLIGSVLHSLFPFFPLIGDAIGRYRIEREIKADTFAVKKVGDAVHLIRVLKKLLTFPGLDQTFLASIADHDTIEPRIYFLLNKSFRNKPARKTHYLVTFISLLIISSAIVFPVHAKEIHHDSHDLIMLCSDNNCVRSCTNKENMSKIYSENKNNKSVPQSLSH